MKNLKTTVTKTEKKYEGRQIPSQTNKFLTSAKNALNALAETKKSISF